MTVADTNTLADQFGHLQRERARTWPPAQLEANAAQRRALREGAGARRIVQPGTRLGPVLLHDLDGAPLSLETLAADGGAVLVFFRFAGCPADNIAIPFYDRRLTGVLGRRGVRLVAISPQVPGKLRDLVERHDLALTVASDPDNALARRSGLTFAPDERPSPPPPGWIGEVTGTGTWDLPLTSIVVVDAETVVRSVEVSPDWLDRPEPEAILAAVEALFPQPAEAA